jgi:hypothetical protein
VPVGDVATADGADPDPVGGCSHVARVPNGVCLIRVSAVR